MTFDTFWKGAQVLAVGVLATWLQSVGVDVKQTTGKVAETTQHVQHTATQAGAMQSNLALVLGQVQQAAQHNYDTLQAMKKSLHDEGLYVQDRGTQLAQVTPPVTYVEIGAPTHLPADGDSVVVVEADCLIYVEPSNEPSFLKDGKYQFIQVEQVEFEPPPSVQQMEQDDDGL